MLTDQKQTGLPSATRGRMQLAKPVQTYNSGRTAPAAKAPAAPAAQTAPPAAQTSMTSAPSAQSDFSDGLKDVRRQLAASLVEGASDEQLDGIISLLSPANTQAAGTQTQTLDRQLSSLSSQLSAAPEAQRVPRVTIPGM